MRRIVLAPLILALGLPAQAEVDTSVHEMCLSAVDYKGCIQSQKGGFIKNFFKSMENRKLKAKIFNKSCYSTMWDEYGFKLPPEYLKTKKEESFNRCKDTLTEIGPSVLKVEDEVHSECQWGAETPGVAAYITCVNEKQSSWEYPSKFDSEVERYIAVQVKRTKENAKLREESDREFAKLKALQRNLKRLEAEQDKDEDYRATMDTRPIIRPIIINNPAPISQPIRTPPLQAPNNYRAPSFSSPLAPKQPYKANVHNTRTGEVQNCTRFGNTNTFNCY